ncbi:MAG: hypothetical protein AAF985_22120 [Bacteroidota bacterium]
MENEQQSTLKEAVFAIIDSRIQFIEYEQSNLVKQHEDSPLNERLEKLIRKIEQFSRSLKLLLLLRSHLNLENAKTIFDLLTNGKYLSYSVESLTHLLQSNSLLKTA